MATRTQAGRLTDRFGVVELFAIGAVVLGIVMATAIALIVSGSGEAPAAPGTVPNLGLNDDYPTRHMGELGGAKGWVLTELDDYWTRHRGQ